LGIKSWALLAGMLATIALTGCGGGGGDSTPASCQTQAPLPVSKFSYPDSTFITGSTVDILPTLEVPPDRSLANVPLRFELAAGGLPTGLALDPGSGRISGKVAGPVGGFPFTARLSADCFSGSLTTSAFFTVT
jgi:hypothetical protein